MGIFASLAKRLSARTKRASSAQLVRSTPLLPALRLDNQFSRVGGSLTPLQVSAIIRQADTGSTYQLIDLMNDCRQKDCHLQSLLGTREAALTGLRWVVEPASRDPEDFRRANFVEKALINAMGEGPKESRGFVDTISHLTGAVFYGYAISEIEWGVREFDGQKVLQPVGFRNHSPRRFQFSQTTGSLGWQDAYSTAVEPVDIQARYPYKFIQHQPRVTGDIPAREGIGRVLVWPAIFRTWGISDWLRLGELAWKPWRMGKYKPDASQEEIDGLISALELLTTQGVGVFSDRTELQVAWPERGRGSKTEHEALCQWMGAEMSKAVLGQTLTVQEGERGARSLGEVHDRVRLDIRELDAISMAVTINRDLVIPMIVLNFGTDRPPPKFLFVTDDTVDIGALARAIDAMVRAGLKIPQKWARDKAGIPEPELDDEIMLGRAFMEAEHGLILNNVTEFDGEQYNANDAADPEDGDDEDADGDDGDDDDEQRQPRGGADES